jgi:hypothetical protein
VKGSQVADHERLRQVNHLIFGGPRQEAIALRPPGEQVGYLLAENSFIVGHTAKVREAPR